MIPWCEVEELIEISPISKSDAILTKIIKFEIDYFLKWLYLKLKVSPLLIFFHLYTKKYVKNMNKQYKLLHY